MPRPPATGPGKILIPYTQAQFGNGAIGASIVTTVRPTFGTIQALCRVLDLRLADVIRFTDDPGTVDEE
jgi:hypothetical protein